MVRIYNGKYHRGVCMCLVCLKDGWRSDKAGGLINGKVLHVVAPEPWSEWQMWLLPQKPWEQQEYLTHPFKWGQVTGILQPKNNKAPGAKILLWFTCTYIWLSTMWLEPWDFQSTTWDWDWSLLQHSHADSQTVVKLSTSEEWGVHKTIGSVALPQLRMFLTLADLHLTLSLCHFLFSHWLITLQVQPWYTNAHA